MEVLAISDHLSGCPACRAALAKAAGTAERRVPGAGLPGISPEEPPDYEEMAALLDGTLSEAQSAEVRARLAASPEAAAEFADLQRFREESAVLPSGRHGPAKRETVAAEAPTVGGKILRFPRQRGRMVAALAAAAAVLLSAGWWVAAPKSPPVQPPLWANADLAGLPDDLRRSVEQAAKTGVIEPPPRLSELRPDPGTLAGSAPAESGFRQIDPVGTAIREERPALRWTARDGATSYVVYVVDAAGQLPMVREEVPGDRTAWTPAAPLARGTVYEWQVEARRGAEIIDRAPRPPAPEARFQVLDATQTAELARLEERYRTNPLVLGTAYARAGLEEAASEEFERLARAYPRSAIAQRLKETHGRPAAR